MRLSEFDFPFDSTLIASHPANPPDRARLLVMDRCGGAFITTYGRSAFFIGSRRPRRGQRYESYGRPDSGTRASFRQTGRNAIRSKPRAGCMGSHAEGKIPSRSGDRHQREDPRSDSRTKPGANAGHELKAARTFTTSCVRSVPCHFLPISSVLRPSKIEMVSNHVRSC